MRRRYARLLTVVLTLTPMVLSPAMVPTVQAAEGMRESSTGLEFSLTRRLPGQDTDLLLTGVGVRKKLIFKVYGFGFYVDAAVAPGHLAAFRGQSAARLAGNEDVYEALMTLPGTRLAVMKFVRAVSGSKMKGALGDALQEVSASDPARNAFLRLWDEEIENGEEVLIAFFPGGRVVVYRHGQEKGSVTSPAIARGLLESWLGVSPVSSSIKTGVVARLPEIL
ncbi:MAG: chalcone isomerase family protein [Acidobacteriota bacterium]|nr:chalcone isomerase family protein [Acidobacteriota bacterium]MDQ7088036.1 chalcone isomerase family protein [Acidobacteriota bacterium]